MKTKNFFAILLTISISLGHAQNSMIQGAITSALPNTGIINDIEIISDGTDVLLIAANKTNSQFYAIDIADNDPSDAKTNIVTNINDFQALIDGATGQSNLWLTNFEVNPISHSIYVLAVNNTRTESYLIKIEDDGATVSVLNQTEMTYSIIDWDGENNYGSQDLTWGKNTLYITSGDWGLDGEVATVSAPFIHNSKTTNRATSMFKTNFGGGYFTDAPLERAVFATIKGEDRLMGVTVCAPGFSVKTSDINGNGVLEVQEQFNVNQQPPIKVVHQNQDGKNYLFDLHSNRFSGGGNLIRVGEQYIDGSPLTKSEFNSDVAYLRDFAGNITSSLNENQAKGYTQGFTQIAYWNDCNLLVLEDDVMKLFETGTSASCLVNTAGNGIFENLTTVEILPNPAADYIQVNLLINDFSTEKIEITLYSISGKEVLRQELTNPSTKIDIKNQPKGTYMAVIIKNGERTFKDKIIIQ